MASRLKRKRKKREPTLINDEDPPPPPPFPPVHAVHWSVGPDDRKGKRLSVWLPGADRDEWGCAEYDRRGATRLGSSRSARYNSVFQGYCMTITKWGYDKRAQRFYFWDERGRRYTGLLAHRKDGTSQQSERAILDTMKKVKRTAEFFDPPPEHELPHPLPGEPPAPPPPRPPTPPRPTPPRPTLSLEDLLRSVPAPLELGQLARLLVQLTKRS